MIVVDTSALVGSLAGDRRSAPVLERLLEAGEVLVVPTLVLYEWRRGSRTHDEIATQEKLMPSGAALPLTREVALRAAELFRRLRAKSVRSTDLVIAAHALDLGAALWTLNPKDFADVPELLLL